MFFYDPVRLGTADGDAEYPPETMILWRPGQRQYYGNDKTKYCHSWIHCDGLAVRRLIRSNRIPTNQAFPMSPSLVEQFLLAMHEEMTSPLPADENIAITLLELFCRRIHRHLQRAKQPPAVPERFRLLQLYLENHFHESAPLANLAKRCHCSIPHFCNEFKHYFHCTAVEYVTRLRMHQAEYLLRDENLTVTDIARRVGYEDIYYFSKRFKEYFGLSPRNLRKRFNERTHKRFF